MEKKHYFLVAGIIYFGVEGTEQVNSVFVNGIVTGENTNITARRIGLAQQALQMNLQSKVGDLTVSVRDVAVMNISHLGYMTQEEFQAVPEGHALQEVKDILNEQAN